MTAKDVLRSCIEWKRKVDQAGESRKNMGPASISLYDAVTAWQESKALASVDKEVFDDPTVED